MSVKQTPGTTGSGITQRDHERDHGTEERSGLKKVVAASMVGDRKSVV